MPLHFGRFHPCQFLDDSSHGYAKYSIYLSDDSLAAQRFCRTRLYFSVRTKTFLSQKTVFIQRFSVFPRKKILLPYLIWIGIYYVFFIAIGWYRFSMRDLIEYIFWTRFVRSFISSLLSRSFICCCRFSECCFPDLMRNCSAPLRC